MTIVVIGGLGMSLINFRGPLLRTMVCHGHRVLALAPEKTPQIQEQLAELGVRYIPLRHLRRTGTNPWQDWQARRELTQLMKQERPDTVLAYTIKPIVHGLPAARAAGVPGRFALVTGLGAAFHTPGLKGAILSAVAGRLYRSALRDAKGIFVQNSETKDILKARCIIDGNAPVIVLPGSGVDVEHYRPAPPPAGITFLLLARLLRDKGIAEFVAAARICKTALPGARYVVAGSPDPNPAAIPAAQLAAWQGEGVVEFREAVADVRPMLAECLVYVLPSYHEGMPRSVLEAMATARAVITTDTIGCRETVAEAGPPDAERVRTGVNGLLVPVKDAQALATAMMRLGRDPARCRALGLHGRELVEQRFDVRSVNRLMLRAMQLDIAPGEGNTVPCAV